MKGVVPIGNYFRSPEMMSGRGFRCFNCGKLLAVKLKGQCAVAFSCPRCKAYIFVKMKEPLPWAPRKEEEEKTPKAQVATG